MKYFQFFNITAKNLICIQAIFLLAMPMAYSAQLCRTSNMKVSTPDSRFTVNTDGTVVDKETELMWKICSEGLSGINCGVGTVSTFTWKDALAVAGNHYFAGHMDWRLPNIKELASIVETACYAPAVNLTIFPNTKGEIGTDGNPFKGPFYWASTPRKYLAFVDLAWGINFYTGYDGYPTYNQLVRNDPARLHYVRLVRNN